MILISKIFLTLFSINIYIENSDVTISNEGNLMLKIRHIRESDFIPNV